MLAGEYAMLACKSRPLQERIAMPLTIPLHRIVDDRAEVRHGDTLVAVFDPRALLVDVALSHE